MSNLRNWLATTLVATVTYVAILLVYWSFDDDYLSARWQFEDWWQGGGFLELVALAIGCSVLQVLAGGKLSIWRVWPFLLPFLVFGDCSGKAYQGAAAVGWIGEGTERLVETAHKYTGREGWWEPIGDGVGKDAEWVERDAFWLVVEDDCCSEWELPDGTLLEGFDIRVSEETYQAHRVGSEIAIVELPGEAAYRYQLSEGVRASILFDIAMAVIWLAIAVIWPFRNRRELTGRGYIQVESSHG